MGVVNPQNVHTDVPRNKKRTVPVILEGILVSMNDKPNFEWTEDQPDQKGGLILHICANQRR